MVEVELVYIPSSLHTVFLQLQVPEGATILDVLHTSKIFEIHPETCNMAYGIFGKTLPLTSPVVQGDRVEVYRPLLIDPKEKRRQRVVNKKSTKS